LPLPQYGRHAILYAMGKQAALYVAVFSTAAIFIGWHYAFYKGSAAELATRLRQIPRLRSDRDKHFSIVTLFAVIFAVVLYVIATKHHHH
jgi:archaellum biogenesis protein FlaJ (TadC family)